MNLHLTDERPTARQRQLDDLRERNLEPRVFDGGQTSLERGLGEWQKKWLLEHCINQWNTCYSGLGSWRNKMANFEKIADDDYSFRRAAPDPDVTDAIRTIFERQNHSLGMGPGFADFVFSQAKDDIFGVRPWLAATPEGKGDNELAELLPKHSQWKFNQSNFESVLVDALRLACDLGTAFVKERYLKEVETVEEVQQVAHSISTGEPILDDAGDYVRDLKSMPEGLDGEDIDWREILVRESKVLYENIEACVLDWKEVAFDATADELDLRKTPFFNRFRRGVHDLCRDYGLSDERKEELLNAAMLGIDENAREHRGEVEHGTLSDSSMDAEANPLVTLVEGFIRCDPFNNGSPIRVHVVFSPDLQVLFRCEYLQHVTPGGLLPVFPIRCFKTPRRVIGKGYIERLEDSHDALDSFYNIAVVRAKESAEVYVGMKRSGLKDEAEGEDLVNYPGKIHELAEDAKDIGDVVSFARKPDTNATTETLLNQMLQMQQLRFGITSSAQGELKGVPHTNTATGNQILASRGALLVKAQLGQMLRDVEDAVEFGVHLIYANQNRDETFTWGEGADMALLEIKAGDVRGLRMNVTLSLTQSQNMQKLDNAKAAIEVAASYTQLPETEKQAQRALYVQALASLGFNEAEDIIREAIVDPNSLAAILPPEMQGLWQSFVASINPAEPAVPEAAAPVVGEPVV